MNKRIMPHNSEMEKSVLAAMILYPDSCQQAIDQLNPDEFYTTVHQKVFTAIKDLQSKTGQVDLVLLVEYMSDFDQIKDVGGTTYLAKLCDFPVPASMNSYIDVIKDKAILRQLIITANKLSNAAFFSSGESASKILEQGQKNMLTIGTNRQKQYHKMSDLIMAGIDRYEALNKKAGITGLSTGFDTLDSVTGGFQNGDLIIIAARPSMGKTALMSNIARNMAINGHSVGIFSIEMLKDQIIDRMMAGESGVTTVKFRQGGFSKANWNNISDAARRLYEIPIVLDDSSDLNQMELRSKARSMVTSEGAEIVFVDYMGLLIGEKGFGRVEEVSSISRNLKAMAKELNIPVVVLSQLNRLCEGRDDKRPRLVDLRDSGSVEQDADLVLFIYRPIMYQPKTADAALAEIIIAKHRNGPTGTVKLKWNRYTTKFDSDKET